MSVSYLISSYYKTVDSVSTAKFSSKNRLNNYEVYSQQSAEKKAYEKNYSLHVTLSNRVTTNSNNTKKIKLTKYQINHERTVSFYQRNLLNKFRLQELHGVEICI